MKIVQIEKSLKERLYEGSKGLLYVHFLFQKCVLNFVLQLQKPSDVVKHPWIDIGSIYLALKIDKTINLEGEKSCKMVRFTSLQSSRPVSDLLTGDVHVHIQAFTN